MKPELPLRRIHQSGVPTGIPGFFRGNTPRKLAAGIVAAALAVVGAGTYGASQDVAPADAAAKRLEPTSPKRIGILVTATSGTYYPGAIRPRNAVMTPNRRVVKGPCNPNNEFNPGKRLMKSIMTPKVKKNVTVFCFGKTNVDDWAEAPENLLAQQLNRLGIRLANAVGVTETGHGDTAKIRSNNRVAKIWFKKPEQPIGRYVTRIVFRSGVKPRITRESEPGRVKRIVLEKGRKPVLRFRNAPPRATALGTRLRRTRPLIQSILNRIAYAAYPDERLFRTRPRSAFIAASRIAYRTRCSSRRGGGLFAHFVRASTGNTGYRTCSPFAPDYDYLLPAEPNQYRTKLVSLGNIVLRSAGRSSQRATLIKGDRKTVTAKFACSAEASDKAVRRVVLRRTETGSHASLTSCP